MSSPGGATGLKLQSQLPGRASESATDFADDPSQSCPGLASKFVPQVSRLWVPGLVNTVREDAVGLQSPAILADSLTGHAFVALLTLGPCVLGWPLRTQRSGEDTLLTWIDDAVPEELFISDPFIATSAY